MFCLLNSEKTDSRSRENVLGVEEKCIRGPGEVRWGSRRYAFIVTVFSAEYHTFIWALKGSKLSKLCVLRLSK